MVLTPSTMQELGTTAPDFSLPAPDGTLWRLADQPAGKGLLVVFMCNHCPYVIHIREKLVEMARRFQEQGIIVVAINSNDAAAYPDDSPEKMAEEAARYGYSFAYLVDGDQTVAKAYGAACTPDFFLFDGEHRLVYRGQFDSARPGKPDPVTGGDLSLAVDQLIAGRPVPLAQQPSMGCNIKWRPGNAPAYFI
jgi:peroxiredoxin